MLSEVEYALNIVVNISSEVISFKLLYNVKIHSILEVKTLNDFKILNEAFCNFFIHCEQLRLKVTDTFTLTKVKMMTYFNKYHHLIKLKSQIYIKVI